VSNSEEGISSEVAPLKVTNSVMCNVWNASFCQPLITAVPFWESAFLAHIRLPRNRPNCLTIRGS